MPVFFPLQRTLFSAPQTQIRCYILQTSIIHHLKIDTIQILQVFWYPPLNCSSSATLSSMANLLCRIMTMWLAFTIIWKYCKLQWDLLNIISCSLKIKSLRYSHRTRFCPKGSHSSNEISQWCFHSLKRTIESLGWFAVDSKK